MGYNILYQNNFTSANQNPIDPTNWSSASTSTYLQVYNAQCCVLSGNIVGFEWMNGAIDFTADSWAQYTVSAQSLSGNTSNIITRLRYIRGSNNGYIFSASADSSGEMYWYVNNPNNSTLGQGFPSPALTVGDVFFCSVIGSTVTFKRNGTTLFSGTDTTTDADGVPTIYIGDGSVYTDTGIIDFSAGSYTATSTISGNAGVGNAVVNYTGTSSGSVTANSSGAYSIPGLASGTYQLTPSLSGYKFTPSTISVPFTGNTTENFTAAVSTWSQPDCRNFGNFPNNAVVVNSTSTYTVEKYESRKAGAPVDSRKSKPVASKKSYPQNTRVNPLDK
jgi:hypothetical protein